MPEKKKRLTHKEAKEVREQLLEFLKIHANKQDTDIAIDFITTFKNVLPLYKHYESYRKEISQLRKEFNIKRKVEVVKPETEEKVNLAEVLKEKELLADKVRKMISLKACSIKEIAKKIDKDSEYTEAILDELINQKYNIEVKGDKYYLNKVFKIGGTKVIDLTKLKGKAYKFGFVTDNHLNSIFERLDVLNAMYDYFVQEGITEVYNAGNWIEGEARFNKNELKNHGVTNQVKYFVDNYPQRKGITTYFVAGDDHEGWYYQREGIDIGEYAEMIARRAGRTDLVYLGYVEADIELKAENGSAKMKVMHPGGGSAYALSYSPQKMIESFQGGEKPQILLLGHYHKADYLYYRDVHCVQGGTTQDQSTFMRKKKLQASVGGWIVEFSQTPDGAIHRFKPEWFPFLNKDYYDRKKYYELAK